MNIFLTGCMQQEGGAFSSLVVFGGYGVIVKGRRRNADFDFGVGRAVYDGLLD
jgi:hypothetical protein